MKPTIALATAITLTLASFTLAQTSSTSDTNRTPTATPSGYQGNTPAGQARQSGASSGATDPQKEQQEFVKDAASGNNMEVQTGQFVSEHSQDPQVKQAAQMLIQDHTQAQQQLKQAAQQAGVPFDDQLNPVHKAMLQELQSKSGKELDRAFAFSAIADHHKDILEYTYASQSLQNAQLKQYATQSLPVLKRHLTMAAALAQSVANVRDTNTASER